MKYFKDVKISNSVTGSVEALSLLKRGATRREVLKSLSMAGLSVAASNLALLHSQNLYASQPKLGGHVRVGVRLGSVSDTLDPATFVNVFIRTMGYAMYNNLVEITGDGSLAPELFESWEVKQGATEWIFKVRQGVEFHNGKTLDADDIITSIQHHRGEDSKSGMKAPLKPIVEIRKDGADTIVFSIE